MRNLSSWCPSGQCGPLKPWCYPALTSAASWNSSPPSSAAWRTSSSNSLPSTTACLPPAFPTPWAFISVQPMETSTRSAISMAISTRRYCVRPLCANSWSVLKCWVCRSGISPPKPPPNNCVPPQAARLFTRHRWSVVLPLLLALCAAAQVITVDHGPNTPAQQSKPYVVLVSLDGFRYDYARKYEAKHLLALGAEGAIAPEGMIPAYPSLTFPNHYSMVTGLYPEHHGIVANNFYDPARKQTYRLGVPATVTDGSWYGGTPIWVLAEQQGMRAACFFWPGSEAEIAGKRPSYYLKYDERIPDEKRVAQVLAWLRLPAEQRPHLITLYFSGVDHAGHEHGPDSEEVRAAVQAV